MAKAAVLPAGQWGSALGKALQANNHSVSWWQPGEDMAFCIEEADFIVLAPPSMYFREVASQVIPLLPPEVIIISGTKGLEKDSLKRPSEIIQEIDPGRGEKFAVVSGPSFADDVASGRPAALVAASTNPEIAEEVQKLFASSLLRLYTSSDVIGVELGGILKNIIALAAGANDGLQCGESARAAIIARGFREMVQLAVAEGARMETLMGLSGLGDLILTATSQKSRNYQAGFTVGKSNGKEGVDDGVTREGFQNAQLIQQLCQRHNVQAFLFFIIAEVAAGKRSPKDALQELMQRPADREAVLSAE